MNLSSLRAEAERLAGAVADARRRSHAGLASALDFSSLFNSFGAATSPEGFACAREERDRAADDAARARARRLMAVTTRLGEGRLTARADEALLGFETGTTIRLEDELLPFRDVPRRILNEADRETRARMAKAFDDVLPRLDAPLSRRVEARQKIADLLGFSSYEALRADVSGVDLAKLEAEAAEALRSTDDAFRDLLAFAFKRLDIRAALKPKGDAALHDLVRLTRLHELDDVFAPKRLELLVSRFCDDVNLSPDASGRLELDDARRRQKRTAPFIAAVHAPRQLALVQKPVGGAPDFLNRLFLLGAGHSLAHADDGLPVEDRVPSDGALVHGFGLTFAHFLVDRGFLQRHAAPDPHDAIEAARLVAVAQLVRLRTACALLPYERTLYREGPREDLRDLYRECLRKALFVDAPVTRWLLDVEDPFASADALRGHALEAGLHLALLDAANEDHWRNPRLGTFLKDLWERGQRDPADVAKELKAPYSVTGAAARLVAVASR